MLFLFTDPVLLSSLVGQNSMDLCRIAAMGHSFGGATVIETLCKEVKFKYEISHFLPSEKQSVGM